MPFINGQFVPDQAGFGGGPIPSVFGGPQQGPATAINDPQGGLGALTQADFDRIVVGRQDPRPNQSAGQIPFGATARNPTGAINPATGRPASNLTGQDIQQMIGGGQQIQPQPFGQGQPLQQPQQFQQQGLPSGVPQTGLIGSEQALQGGLNAQLGALNQFGAGALSALGGGQDQANAAFGQARGDVTGAFNQGVQGLQGFSQGGQGAFDVQNALAGGAGVQAQQQALGNLQPVSQFLQDQGNRQIASAVGRRGFSGDTIREASRFGQGLASQSLNDQFGRLAQTSGQGLQAAGQIGGLRGQQGGIFANLGANQASNALGFGQAGSSLLNNLGINQANAFGNTANQVSQGRTNFGQNLGTALGTGASNVANLQQAGGAGASDILGGAAADAANLQTGFGNLSANDQQQLAAILANLSTGQAAQFAGLPSTAQFKTPTSGLLKDIAQVASGFGNAAAGFNA